MRSEVFFKNDVYHKLNLTFEKLVADDKCQLIYPANDDLILKHSADKKYHFLETYETYQRLTRPQFIDQIDHAKFNIWLQNILDGKVQSSVLETDEFCLNRNWEFEGSDKT